MRLFVALVPPPVVLDEVEEAVAPLKAEGPELAWIRRELIHVTLSFLGAVDDRTLDRLLPRLERAVARHGRLSLSLAGAGAFPGNGAHARVLWTGLYGDRRGLAGLAASTSAAGRRAGDAPRQAPVLPAAPHARPLPAARGRAAGDGGAVDVRGHRVDRRRRPPDAQPPPGKLHGQVEYESMKTWSLR